jgi:hypothetical protein
MLQVLISQMALSPAIDGGEDLVHAGERGLGQFQAILAVLFACKLASVEVVCLVDVPVLVAPLLDDLDVGQRDALVVDLQEVIERHLSPLAAVEVLEERTHLLLQEGLLLEAQQELLWTDLVPVAGQRLEVSDSREDVLFVGDLPLQQQDALRFSRGRGGGGREGGSQLVPGSHGEFGLGG